jgi:hypothetical protein
LFERAQPYGAVVVILASSMGCAGHGGPPAAPAQPTPAPTDAPSEETSRKLAGAWQGPVGEEGLEYQVCMQVGVAPDSPNPIQYFGDLNCSGNASFIGSSASVHTFEETLNVDNDSGACAPHGKIEARLNSDGTLDWRWFDPDSSTPRATSVLKQQPACPGGHGGHR